MDQNDRLRTRLQRVTRTAWWLVMFCEGKIKPREAELDAHCDVIYDLMEAVNDCRYPDALELGPEPELGE